MILFNEWLPDLPALNNPGCTVAKNVLPSGISYKKVLAAAAYSDALDARARGAVGVRQSEGTSHNFAGNASKLYKLSSGAWDNVSIVGGYSTGATEKWFFTQWGEVVLATNFSNVIQSYTLGSSTDFANLGGSPPQARYTGVVKDFLVVANTYDGVDGNVPHRVRWAGQGSITNWTVSSTTLADYQNLDNSVGWIKQFVGGEYGVIFQEQAISRMTFEGAPTVFRFDQVETGRGTRAPGSVVKFGNLIAYLGLDGFYVFDGNQSINIGANKIDKFFYDSFDDSYYERIASAHDAKNQLIYWIFPNQSATSGRPNQILVFNYSPTAKNKWSLIEQELEFIYVTNGEPVTLEDLDTLYPSGLDSIPFSLDSSVFAGESGVLACFDSDNKLCFFSGSAKSVTLETKEGEITQGRRTNVSRLRPLVSGSDATITMQLGTRNSQDEAVTWSGIASANDNGDFAFRSDARYHRARLNITGDFDDAMGIQIIEAYPSSAR